MRTTKIQGLLCMINSQEILRGKNVQMKNVQMKNVRRMKDILAIDTTKDFEVSILNYYPIIAGRGLAHTHVCS